VHAQILTRPTTRFDVASSSTFTIVCRRSIADVQALFDLVPRSWLSDGHVTVRHCCAYDGTAAHLSPFHQAVAPLPAISLASLASVSPQLIHAVTRYGVPNISDWRVRR
jgi:hypothetical protein